MSEKRKPWHDTPTHACSNGTSGPVVPFYDGPPKNIRGAVSHVRCAACGHDWLEESPADLAQVYWSAGAWQGHDE